ncbi:MAG: hypothetical protein A4E65_03557 [Syntrophorhabdus sp. PtaU1.Bin153]|nr:MAG: hypothetical protein A4E65_03557 [Syntrophorhabdus sp. PtaU1.Bin153]
MKIKEIDPEFLAACNGKNGNPTYIAHNGRVIDVSASTLWQGGLHMQRHSAGKDLTADINAAPHGLEVLDRYPQVGILKEKGPPERPMPNVLAVLLRQFPLLRRHPHPAIVHFPVALMVCPFLFCLLYLVTGARTFETTAFHCLGAGVLFIPPAMATGFFTWWLNYMAKPVRQVTIKIWLSSVMLIIAIVAFLWRIFDPSVLQNLRGPAVIYLVLVFVLAPLALTVGYYGGTLTFPFEQQK